MITETHIFTCHHCGSARIVKNGHTRAGQQQYRCKDCQRSGLLTPHPRYTEAQREQILTAYRERPSLRGLERLFGVARQTVGVWLKKSPCAAAVSRDGLASGTG